ncbi:septum site-determining protein MinC, partial [Cribrihabitans sp. XS_ASV171]
MQKHSTASRSGHASLAPQPFQLRGRFLTAVALRLENDQLDKGFYDSLDAQLQRAPQLLLDAPLILDFGQVPRLADPEALRELVNHLKARNLHVFGVQNAAPATREATARLGLIPVEIGRDIPAEQVGGGGRRKPGKRTAPANILVTEPVRSGRVIMAEHG